MFLLFLQTYVANILSGCFKSRLGVPHVAVAPVACRRALALTSCLPRAARLALSSPSPPFPSLHLVAAVQARWETLPDEHANARGGGGLGGPTAAQCSRSGPGPRRPLATRGKQAGAGVCPDVWPETPNYFILCGTLMPRLLLLCKAPVINISGYPGLTLTQL
jgi:hypothetical protein